MELSFQVFQDFEDTMIPRIGHSDIKAQSRFSCINNQEHVLWWLVPWWEELCLHTVLHMSGDTHPATRIKTRSLLVLLNMVAVSGAHPQAGPGIQL